MEGKDDGGPAFPESGARGQAIGGEGMSLRDYFAAKAMQAEMITSFSDATPDGAAAFVEGADDEGHSMEEHLAVLSYAIADAMLAERRRK